MLRKAKVVGKFVEYFGEGAASLPVADRATIANMAPEYGATMGYFPIDEETCRYLAADRPHARSRSTRSATTTRRRGCSASRSKGEIDYTTVLELDLGTVAPSVAGPKRPQDRIELPTLKTTFGEHAAEAASPNGYGKTARRLAQACTAIVGVDARPASTSPAAASRTRSTVAAGRDGRAQHERADRDEMMNNRPTPDRVDADALPDEFPTAVAELDHGDVLIAAITSCTNTSNPSVMLAAGLLAKKAVERGLQVPPAVKTSLAPGSRVVTEYYRKTGLQPYLDQLGFHTVGYGCTTCIGNSGPLDPRIEEADHRATISSRASVLSRQPQLRGARAPERSRRTS